MAYITKKTTRDGTKPIGSNLYGVCSSSASAQTKVVTMSDFDVLVEGVTIHVYFQNGNSANNPLLQVGSTTAKAIRYNGVSGGTWESGGFRSFTYYQDFWVQNDVDESGSTYGLSFSNGTLSIVENGGSSSVSIPDDNTTYTISKSGTTVTLTGSDGDTSSFTDANNRRAFCATCSTSGSTKDKVATLVSSTGWELIAGTIVGVRFNNTNTYAATSSNSVTLNVNSTGAKKIYYGNSLAPTGQVPNAYGKAGYTHFYMYSGTYWIWLGISVEIDSNTTYTLSINDHTLTLTPSSGTAQSVTIPDDDTTYTISNSGSTITLTPSSGSAQSITVPNDDTTYTFSLSGHTLTITPSSGTAQTITLPDDDTTYTMSISGNTLTLTPSSGTAQSVTLPSNALLYTIDGTNNAVIQNDVTNNVASGDYALAEGLHTTASGFSSHAEGTMGIASGLAAHTEGNSTTASGYSSHAQNFGTKASSDNQTALGKYNIEDANDTYAVIVGNGTSDNSRSNALTVDWNGDILMALDTTAASGTDHDLYATITALGWQNDVIV